MKGLKLHIGYIKLTNDPKVRLRKVYSQYLNYLSNESDNVIDEIEQSEISSFFKSRKKKEELREELINRFPRQPKLYL